MAIWFTSLLQQQQQQQQSESECIHRIWNNNKNDCKSEEKVSGTVRVYMDGCFDLMHFGHANALRQAKSLGDHLTVGVVADRDTASHKGTPPVLPIHERVTLVSGLKWVEEVISNVPYEIDENYINTLFHHYNINYIIHGDDPCILPDGIDAYALAKKTGRYKQLKRTGGVSTTDIIGRILSSVNTDDDIPGNKEDCLAVKSHLSRFLPTSCQIVQFSNGKILRSARQLGDFLLVGIHSDQTVREGHLSNYAPP